MSLNVLKDIGRAVSDLVGGTVETIKDVVADIKPGTVVAVAAPEVSAATYAAQIAVNALTNYDFDKNRNQVRKNLEIPANLGPYLKDGSETMPHVFGHEDGEVMVGGIGLENGNLAANVVGFGSQAIQQLGRNLIRGLGSPGGVAGGVAGGLAGNALMDNRQMNGCGCDPKPFVRFNNCDQPIITRKMKKQAIDAVNCNGAEQAAAALTGGDLNLLTMITSKQFKPVRRGISGAQLSNAGRTARKLNRMHNQFQKMCKKK